MKRIYFLSLCFLQTLSVFSHPRQVVDTSSSQPDRARYHLIFENPATLTKVREAILSGSKEYTNAMKQLMYDADTTLKISPVSVMEKKQLPPTGDKHDYMSLGRYFWPDPSKPNGLPYISRDGEVNPEIYSITDYNNFWIMTGAVHTLALAYYFTGIEKYADHAANMIRVWFLNADTKMNPNLNFCQAIKGLNNGRPTGLIETREIGLVADAVALLTGSKAWTEKDQKELMDWFTKYLDWLLTSPNGTGEVKSPNNHGLWFDVQLSSVALSVGREDLVRRIVEDAKRIRIGRQIEPDGTMPLELARTTSKHYIQFTLEGFFRLASIAERVGIDLWNYQTKDGRNLQKALDYPIPYILGQKKWTYEQIHEYKWNRYYPLYLRASKVYKNQTYQEVAKKLSGDKSDSNRLNLIFGKMEH